MTKEYLYFGFRFLSKRVADPEHFVLLFTEEAAVSPEASLFDLYLQRV